MNNLIFDPLEEYRDKFRPLHKENVSEFFEELVKQSKVDPEGNKATVKKAVEYETAIKKETNGLQKLKNLRGFLIFLIVAFFVVAALFIYQAVVFDSAVEPFLGLPLYSLYLIGLLSLGVAIFTIVMISKKIKPRIKNSNEKLIELNKVLKKLIEDAWHQMAPLNGLFDPDMTPRLVEKTVPLIKMDPYFDSKRLDYLHTKYDLTDMTPITESAQFVQSGEISGNPFILARSLNMNMSTQVYTGSIVITWSVTVTVNGKPQRQTRSQTLTATVSKPKPFYNKDTIIIYGNEAAERLSFSRGPVLASDWTEKSLRQLIANEEKKMAKMVEKSLKNNKQFTPIGNSQFEALFQAYDRDDEMQFRLLFTALGQSEMLDLIKDKKVGFGDNFEFYKRKNINVVRSLHNQAFDLSANPTIYQHYDLEEIRKRFNEYNNEYLRRFYFNIAPILAIPLYQQQKPHEFIYQQEYKSHLSFYEHEAAANQIGSAFTANPLSTTENILKTKLITKGVDYDIIEITSYGYRTENRTDFITKLGGDGRMHTIPVHWVEYIPVEKTSTASVKVMNEEQINAYRHNDAFSAMEQYLAKYTAGKPAISGRRIFAFLLKDSFSEKDNAELDNVIKQFTK